jgi:hypothetical protein
MLLLTVSSIHQLLEPAGYNIFWIRTQSGLPGEFYQPQSNQCLPWSVREEGIHKSGTLTLFFAVVLDKTIMGIEDILEKR